MTQAKIIAFDQVASYDEAGGAEAEKIANKPAPTTRGRRR
jgi:hypothetical protein